MNLLELFPLNPKKRGVREMCTDDFEHPIVFVERFWRWRDSLFVVASRILRDPKAATCAVEACFRRACQNPPKFTSDGEFGSWVLRLLVDEALQARRCRRWAPKGYGHQAFAPRGALVSQRPWLDDFWCLETTV